MYTAGRPYRAALALLLLSAACTDQPDPVSVDSPEARADLFLSADMAMDSDGATTVVDPFRHRLETEFMVEGELAPGTPIFVRIHGVANEEITGGTVRILMPTVAAIEYAGPDKRPQYPAGAKFPTVASFTLAAMYAGAQWEGTVEVGPLEEGYYHIVALTDAQGPGRSPYLFDEGYQQAWMYVIGGGGFLTRVFDKDVFPPETAPLPGPFRVKGEPYGAPAQASADGGADSDGTLAVRVLFVAGDHSKKAVGASIWAETISDEDPDDDNPTLTERRTVGSSGIVHFTCPGSGQMLRGASRLPTTGQVEGAAFNSYWDAYPNECGGTITVVGPREAYLPWRNLDDAADRIESAFGVSRSRMAWSVNLDLGRSQYDRRVDEVQFGATYGDSWTAAHEFTHALHHEQLGGLWSTEQPACQNHIWEEPSGYKCAFQEGFADYGGNIGAPDNKRFDAETFHRSGSSDGDPAKFEGNIGALFNDLVDGGTNESGDKTSYSIEYVLDVFESCRVRVPYTSGGGGGFIWYDRNDVSDFVWCLENRIVDDVHEDHFPGIKTPVNYTETASKPSSWNADNIRSTWRLNVGSGGES